ncbi:MAG: hypothetical protein DMG08_10290 [Acidobacteria bacterium]|nr:MAG: hypothetical protein DMG08_10290 [Acidobacteriota bacterium]
MSELAELYRLTGREREAIGYLLQGLTSKEIAVRMEISPNTVKSLPALCQGQDGRDYAVRDCWKDLYRPASASPAVICFRDTGLLVKLTRETLPQPRRSSTKNRPRAPIPFMRPSSSLKK